MASKKSILNNIPRLVIVMFLAVASSMQFSCKEAEDGALPDVTANTFTISGTVKLKESDTVGSRLTNWHYGAAMIRAGEYSNAALSSDGNFTLTLPATIKGSEFVNMNDFAGIQGGTCVAAPAATNFAGPVEFVVDYIDKGEAKSMAIGQYMYTLVSNKPVISKTYTYNFYDRDGTFSGTSYLGKIFDWSFTKGWGMIENFYSVSASAYASRSVLQAPADLIWTNKSTLKN